MTADLTDDWTGKWDKLGSHEGRIEYLSRYFPRLLATLDAARPSDDLTGLDEVLSKVGPFLRAHHGNASGRVAAFELLEEIEYALARLEPERGTDDR